MPPAAAQTRAIAWARTKLGQHEDGENTGPFVRECQAATFLEGTGWPWCIAFIQRAFQAVGAALPYLGAGAYNLLDWFRAHEPAWVVPLDQAEPGAIVIFNVGTGHGALLDRPYRDTRPNVVTVGGNEADAVRRVTRDAHLVRGVIQPPKPKPHAPTPPPAAPVPVKLPVYEVVTSADGEQKTIYVSGQNAIAKRLKRFLDRWGKVTIRKKAP